MEEKKELTEAELNKIALRKGLDEYYKKTGKSPMGGNQAEALEFVKNLSKESEKVVNETINSIPESAYAHVGPSANFNPEDYKEQMMKETDPDLLVDFDIVKLPSNGKFYPIKEVKVEYLTSKDEDLLTTPSLMENGTALDELFKKD